MRHRLVTSFASVLLVAAPSWSQDAAPAASFSREHLEQLVAPIALYPDPVLTQVLMASTYPIEIVAADRWVDDHPGLTGASLDAELRNESWTPAVKALVALPEVLNRMSENLEWTRDLGDAFLSQEAELMDAAQRMRQKAREAGNLNTTEQQTVSVNEDQTIVVEQQQPEVVYVPEYSTAAYGSSWSYSTPMYSHLYSAGWGAMGWGRPWLIGAGYWGQPNWAWGGSSVTMNYGAYNNWNNRFTPGYRPEQFVPGQTWQHDPRHRGGVPYSDPRLRAAYGRPRRGDLTRGWNDGTLDRPRRDDRTRDLGDETVNRPNPPDARQPTVTPRPRPDRNPAVTPGLDPVERTREPRPVGVGDKRLDPTRNPGPGMRPTPGIKPAGGINRPEPRGEALSSPPSAKVERAASQRGAGSRGVNPGALPRQNPKPNPSPKPAFPNLPGTDPKQQRPR